jgi:hypothetical protein
VLEIASNSNPKSSRRPRNMTDVILGAWVIPSRHVAKWEKAGSYSEIAISTGTRDGRKTSIFAIVHIAYECIVTILISEKSVQQAEEEPYLSPRRPRV